jgi:pyruvate formate lyase activating enzyme
MKGIVFNIQRFSIHDGPGIRTTVFLKGCNNRCEWCHNPESLNMKPELQLYLDKCIGCLKCFENCPVNAHDYYDGERIFHRDICTGCGKCAEECYARALVLQGSYMTVEQVMSEILKDKDYYQNSKGGVTFSGGEPLLQPEFLVEVLKECKKNNINTAIETAGNVSWSTFEKVLPYLDLVMYDLKALDEDIYRKYISNNSKQIKENLLKLAEANVDIIVRTPVIGGVNDEVSQISSISAFIKDIKGLLYYELLPYHNLALSKYKGLGIQRESKFYTPDKAQIDQLANAARQYINEVRPK